tara:strand:- start:1688 stop:2863 length:1176 start_codon:yes stop_codon:yes gene_type:complete
MILIFQSILYTLLGLLRKKSFKIFFFFLLLALPYSNAFQKYFYFLGVYVFLFFVFSDAFSTLSLKRISRNSLSLYILLFLAAILYAILTPPFKLNVYLKDIFFVFLLLLLRSWKDNFFLQSFNKKSLRKIVIVTVYINFCYALFLYVNPNFLTLIFDDPFYSSQFRLTTLFVYLIPFIVYNLKNLNLKKRHIFLLYAIALIAGSRINIMLISLFHLFALEKRERLFFLFFLGILFLIATINVTNFRAIEQLKGSIILNDLLVRYGPFFDILEKFDFYDYIFGKGPGFGIYIPWFEYRGLDPYNAYLDSQYLTFYLKYGVLMFPIIIFILHEVKLYVQHKEQFRAFLLWFLIIGLTNAITYLYVFLFAIIFCKLNGHSTSNVNHNETSKNLQ